MSDNQWQSPSGSSPEPFRAPDAFTPPGGSAPLPGPPQPTGWTPPPKPGLIPLRPLTLGDMLGAAFRVLRRNPRPTFGVALLFQAIVLVVTVVVLGLFALFVVSRIANATDANRGTISAGAIGLGIAAYLIPVLLSIVASAVLSGVISLEVSRATLGEKLKFAGLWRRAKGRIGALVGWVFILFAATLVALALVGGLVVLIVTRGGTVSIVAGVLVGMLLAFLLFAAALWLGTKLAFVPASLLLERLTLRRAISRSWRLTRGFFWKTLGILLLVAVMIQVATSVVTAPLQVLTPLLNSTLNPNGNQTALTGTSIVLAVIVVILTTVIASIGTVIQTATTVLLYIDVRMRKEGLDQDLTRFVEARQGGSENLGDPYLPAESVPGGPPVGATDPPESSPGAPFTAA